MEEPSKVCQERFLGVSNYSFGDHFVLFFFLLLLLEALLLEVSTVPNVRVTLFFGELG